jgi:hypothetical protein
MSLDTPNKPQRTGTVILSVGVALLIFTFINAFIFLQQPFSILATGDLGSVFGEALAPLIQACIRLMYLGIMGWIGSMLTIRGIPLVTHRQAPITPVAAPQQPHTQPQVTPEPKQTPHQPRVKEPQQIPKIPPVQPVPPPPPPQEEPIAILIPPENQREE